jgi:ketosteroid isomerase-like protein
MDATVLSDDDIKAIAALQDEWIERELTGEQERLVELCTDGVVLVPPGQPPVVGRAAVSEWLGRPAAELLSLTVDIRLLRGGDATAYKLAEFQSSFLDTATGERRIVSGSHVWALERDASGAWRVALVTWSVYA